MKFKYQMFLGFQKRLFSSSVNNQSRECYVKDFENGMSKIILNRPHKMNSIGKQILTELEECIDHVSNRRVLIIESSCEKAFSTGADLKERIEMNGEDTLSFVSRIRKVFDNLANLSVPTIACIDGLALGGGFELALACDIRVASFRSKMGFPETKLSIFPAAGGTQRLLWLIGPAKAKELIFAADIIDADYAKMLGIVNHVSENPSELCGAISDKIIQNGKNQNLRAIIDVKLLGPLGVSCAKIAIDSGLRNIIGKGLIIENEQYRKLIDSEDRIEGLHAFADKRKPIYKGK